NAARMNLTITDAAWAALTRAEQQQFLVDHGLTSGTQAEDDLARVGLAITDAAWDALTRDEQRAFLVDHSLTPAAFDHIDRLDRSSWSDTTFVAGDTLTVASTTL